ncbi:phospholipid scramblase 1-like isoform X2 [Mizuhopecten yessoensis]|uniref:Phospholipid scramblase n=2 Tax=Mizuhopecten yessoensis TaxID=6573 RepID=A0A210QTL8_MIZYE|nr:phospholipid scramblase 1-like isoform X2 [Mizuhopecten yessoensis]OWF52069.1 Phospholipid scramblase 3 [Mizuhopecten yessoensis]
MELDGIVMKQPVATNESTINALDYLANLDFVKIRQKVDIAELITPWEVQNRYEVCDANDRVFITVTEESATCQRVFCTASQRSLVLHIQDISGQELAQIKKDFKCCAGGSVCAKADCCAMEMFVERPVGQPIAHVRQMFYCCFPKFHVFDGYGKQVFEMTGPCCPCQGPGCYDDLEYPLSNSGGSDSGAKVTKIWDGAGRACCTNANTFGIHFPANMDVQKKLSLFGAVFVLDYFMFESNDNE